jgi:hypothetical protein
MVLRALGNNKRVLRHRPNALDFNFADCEKSVKGFSWLLFKFYE